MEGPAAEQPEPGSLSHPPSLEPVALPATHPGTSKESDRSAPRQDGSTLPMSESSPAISADYHNANRANANLNNAKCDNASLDCANREIATREDAKLVSLFSVWLSIGLQSFGGGATTLTLIRRAFVDHSRWITETEFSRCWALVQVVPGINLLALTIVIGMRLCGWPGIAVSLLGLLLPSGSITVVLTAFWVHFQHYHAAQYALKGIIPATVGIGTVTALQIAKPLILESRKRGTSQTIIAVAVLVLSALAASAQRVPVVLILLAGGFAGALAAASSHGRMDGGAGP
jgi:chromate transporter